MHWPNRLARRQKSIDKGDPIQFRLDTGPGTDWDPAEYSAGVHLDALLDYN